ncbi:DMT family transporter [Tenacibaculum agarivorans]|uniref:DMT family transporter n=1 Tax=Tenacibaculum agarivorans TaxID=1908389 RepID=UPI00094B9100|nr:DMT family transporter [Tenacibaculum agarivorans]
MKLEKKFISGVLIGLLGIILFSSKAVLVKLVYNYNVDAITTLLLRMLFSFPFYVIIAILYRNEKRAEEKNQQKDYVWVLFFGIVGYYLASYFDFVGLTYIKASLERIILFIYPTIVLVFNKWFLKKPINKHQKIAILITYIGIIVTFGNEVSLSGKTIYIGGFYVVLSAITYASYLVGSGWLIPKFGVMRFTAYAMLVSCICVFIHFGLQATTNILDLPFEVYILGFCIAIFATVIPSFLVSISIKMISSSNFAIIAAIGPISTILLAFLFLDERLTVTQVIGTIIVILGVLNVKK